MKRRLFSFLIALCICVAGAVTASAEQYTARILAATEDEAEEQEQSISVEDEEDVPAQLSAAPEDEEDVPVELSAAPEDEEDVPVELSAAPEDEEDVPVELSAAPEELIVTFDPGDGNIKSSMRVMLGNSYGDLPTPTRSGYQFDGWFTADGTQITPDTKVNMSGNLTLYAHWTWVLMYKVTFDFNDESGYTTSKTVTNGETYGALPTRSREHYDFDGWFTEREGGEQITSSTPVDLSNDQTLYAHWTRTEYTVTFDPNGGSVNPTSKTVTIGATYEELPTPTLTNYRFDGWFTADREQITSSTPVDLSNDQTLYAHWTRLYTVTFEPNSGTVDPTSKIVAYGEPYGELPTPTLTNYRFDGWFTSYSGTTQIKSDTTVNLSGNQTLYAHWTPQYTVTFDPNGGTVDPTSKIVTKGDTYGDLPTPVYNSREFIGWFTYSGTQITSNSTVSLSNDQTLYAHWRTYTVTFNPGNGSVNPTSKTVIQGEPYGELPTPTRSNYRFDGWFTYSETQIKADTTVNLSGNQTLYAHWTRLYTLTFDPKGGTVTPTSIPVPYGEPYGELPTPKRDYYRFDGWFTASSGGTPIKSDSKFSLSYDQTVYAHWTRTECTVTFDPNGGSIDLKSKIVTIGKAYGELPTPKRDHYRFDGWFTASSGGTQITPETTVNLSYDHTLYAHWTRTECTVTFYTSSGSVNPTSKIVTIGATYGDLPTPKRDYYRFDGWFTASSSDTKITPETKVNLSNDQTLYAHWTRLYTVTLDPGSGTVTPTSITVAQGDPYGELPTPKRDNYRFDGWFTYSETQITSETKVNLSSNLTLHAHWTRLYTVTFNPNGGTVTPTSKAVAYYETYGELPTPVYNSREFIGWFTSSTGGTQIKADTKVNLSDNQTLYAHWRTYTVTFDPNGGTVNPTSKTVIQSEPYGELPTATRTNYHFNGWFTTSTGDTQITTETKVNLSYDQTLYAHWTRTECTVTFDPKGGSVNPTSKIVTIGATYEDLPTPKRDYYRFDGWFTASADGTQITAETTVNLSDNHTLYAHWTRTECTVTFYTNSGSVNPTSKIVTIGKAYGELPTPKRDYYRFDGWFTASTGGTQITAETTVNLSNDQTLYAHWTRLYTVTLDPGNGSVTPTSVTVAQGDPYGELPTPTRTNYRFVGWFTYSETQITSETTVNLSGNQTLYAHWTRLYTVTFNANGGSVKPASITVALGDLYGELPTPTWQSHEFVGWFTSSDTGTQIKSDSKVNLSDNQTLYAHWRTYTVTFNANGGSVNPTSKTVTKGGTYGDLPTPTHTTYNFAGWFTSKDGNTQITSETTVSLSENQTLYAHWRTYTVTFNANGGGSSMSPRKLPDDGTFVFPKCEFKLPPESRMFVGWLLNGTVYQPGDTVQLNANAIAVAQWLTITDILPNWKNVTVQLSNAAVNPVSVVVCAYSNDGKMLSCAVKTVNSGATVSVNPSITGAAYLQAFLLSPDTSAPLCAPFHKNLN